MSNKYYCVFAPNSPRSSGWFEIYADDVTMATIYATDNYQNVFYLYSEDEFKRINHDNKFSAGCLEIIHIDKQGNRIFKIEVIGDCLDITIQVGGRKYEGGYSQTINLTTEEWQIDGVRLRTPTVANQEALKIVAEKFLNAIQIPFDEIEIFYDSSSTL